jgi:hypothetical protein
LFTQIRQLFRTPSVLKIEKFLFPPLVYLRSKELFWKWTGKFVLVHKKTNFHLVQEFMEENGTGIKKIRMNKI